MRDRRASGRAGGAAYRAAQPVRERPRRARSRSGRARFSGQPSVHALYSSPPRSALPCGGRRRTARHLRLPGPRHMGGHLGRRAVGKAGSRSRADARPRRDDALPGDIELFAGGRSAAAGCVGTICRRRARERAADRGVVPAVVRERRARPAAVAGGGALPLAQGRGVRLVRARHRGEGRALGGKALGAAARLSRACARQSARTIRSARSSPPRAGWT